MYKCHGAMGITRSKVLCGFLSCNSRTSYSLELVSGFVRINLAAKLNQTKNNYFASSYPHHDIYQRKFRGRNFRVTDF